jgi:pectate lyase
VGKVSASAAPPAVVDAETFADSVDGFASVNALGQNGTTGGAGGPVVTATR